MFRAENLKFHLLFSAVVLFSFWPRFCRAQGGSTSPSSNPCEANGGCGPFGVCNQQQSSFCTCLPGFYPRNDPEWDSGNWTSGCVRRAPLDCEGNNRTTDGFLKQKMRLSGYTDMWRGPETQCENRCLSDCSCLAYGYDFNVGCVYWNVTLIGIQKFPSGAASDLSIRVSRSELDQKKKGSKKMIIILVVVGFVIISISTYFSWKWIAKRRGQRETMELAVAGESTSVDAALQDALNQVNLQDFPLFKFDILVNATNNFSESNKLGKGGFGPVYKGELADGKEVAVKRLSEASRQGLQEFVNEVVLISKLQHRNLVRLLGCCLENKETMLIYEYMPNKSLDFFLFDSSQEILDWSKRFNIIEGICRGLLYLHRDSRLKIIHRDLKPSNILLDKDWNAKISDFGTARIFGSQQDHVSTARVVGTYGYLAPEYAMEGRFSEKSDVFSFGVLMLEIATGRRNTSSFDESGDLNLLSYIRKLWSEDNVGVLIDPRISSLRYQGEVMRCIHIGLLCVQQLPMDRPSIPGVLKMLRSDIIELPEPKQSVYAVKPSRGDTGTTSSSSQQMSLNSVTITVVEGR